MQGPASLAVACLVLADVVAFAGDARTALASRTNRLTRAGAPQHMGSGKKLGKNHEPPPVAETAKAEDPVQTIRGKHVAVTLPRSYWRMTTSSNEFVAFLDAGFDKETELMVSKGDITYTGDALKCWGLGGGGTVRIDWPAFAEVLGAFSRSNIVFGVLHEMGHCVDEPGRQRWWKFPESCGECFANIPLSYAFDYLLTTNSGYRVDIGGQKTGREFNNTYYLPQADGYLNSTADWPKIGVDQLHAFHLGLARKYGWDVYKKWFRACLTLEGQGMGPPGGYDHPDRPVVACALMSAFAGADLVPDFQKWRFPVDAEKVAAAMKTYRLEGVISAVDQQFSQELAGGRITLDPLSLRITKERAKMGVARVSVALIQIDKAVVRCTLNGTEPKANSPVYDGPMLLTRMCVVKAGLFLPKQDKPLLVAEESVDPFSLPDTAQPLTGNPAKAKRQLTPHKAANHK